jgi:outer membrane protein assembly factor BamD
LPGCAVYEFLYGKPPSREVRRTDQELLRSAEAQMERRRFDEARKDLQRLMNQYPDSELVSVARLLSAQTLYHDKKYDEAQSEYVRFMELYPQHERLDEAHYYLGLTYFRMADTPDRDQTMTRKALEQFETLLTQMPDSSYVRDARDKSALCRSKLAEKETYVGRFYFDRGHYGAAVGRFRRVLATYPGAGFDDQALYYLGESLWQLEQKDEAREPWTRLIREHSQSEWAEPAARRLGVALVRTGPPKPKGPGPLDRMWDGMKSSWTELGETIKGYQIFK